MIVERHCPLYSMYRSRSVTTTEATFGSLLCSVTACTWDRSVFTSSSSSRLLDVNPARVYRHHASESSHAMLAECLLQAFPMQIPWQCGTAETEDIPPTAFTLPKACPRAAAMRTVGAVNAVQHQLAELGQACKLASSQPRPPIAAILQSPQHQPLLQCAIPDVSDCVCAECSGSSSSAATPYSKHLKGILTTTAIYQHTPAIHKDVRKDHHELYLSEL